MLSHKKMLGEIYLKKNKTKKLLKILPFITFTPFLIAAAKTKPDDSTYKNDIETVKIISKATPDPITTTSSTTPTSKKHQSTASSETTYPAAITSVSSETPEEVEISQADEPIESQLVTEEEKSTSNENHSNNNSQTSQQPKTIYMNQLAIPYENGGQAAGQSIIDSNSNIASTWGGAEIQNGSDGLSTHFIAHNPGIFATLFQLSLGSEIKITDTSNEAKSYFVETIFIVDDTGRNVDTGEDHWDLITGSGNGEAVVLQTCIDDATNLIVFAR